MRAVVFDQPGEAGVMKLKRLPQPDTAPDELLIRVTAAGINRPDLLQRTGLYPAPEGASPIMGLEVAGVVAAVGANAHPWRPGLRVCALTNGGGYADYVNVPATQCFLLPEHISDVEAAALPEALFTVWSNIYDRAKLQPGETLLIHGGTGGIGSIAIQMGRISGARVLTTAGDEAKCALCLQLGAIKAINYRQDDFVQVIKSVVPKGVNVILDVVGGDYVQRNIQVAAPDARIVNIAFQQSAQVQLNLMPVMLKRLTLTGSTLRSRTMDQKAYIARFIRSTFWPAVCAQRIQPIIHRTFPLEEVVNAHELLESGKVVGKLVLTL